MFGRLGTVAAPVHGEVTRLVRLTRPVDAVEKFGRLLISELGEGFPHRLPDHLPITSELARLRVDERNAVILTERHAHGGWYGVEHLLEHVSRHLGFEERLVAHAQGCALLLDDRRLLRGPLLIGSVAKCDHGANDRAAIFDGRTRVIDDELSPVLAPEYVTAHALIYPLVHG